MAQAHAEHHEHHEGSSSMMVFGILGGFAAAAVLGMMVISAFSAPRFASGIAMIAVGILFGTASNAANSVPNTQRFFEWFGVTLIVCGLVRYLHIMDILSKVESPMIASLGKMLMMFM